MTEIWRFRWFWGVQRPAIKLIGLVPLQNKIFWIGNKLRINFVTTLEKELSNLVKIWLCGNEIKVSNLYKNALKYKGNFPLAQKLYFWTWSPAETKVGDVKDLWEFCGVCTIFMSCRNVFKNRTFCKIARELLSFFPLHLLTSNSLTRVVLCLVEWLWCW